MTASIHNTGPAKARTPPRGRSKAPGTLFDALDAAGLVGCIKGPTDLAAHHSNYLKVKARAAKKAAA